MASTFSLLVSLFLAFVFISPSVARHHDHHYHHHHHRHHKGSKSADLRSICDGTIDPHYCWDDLSPHYGSGTIDDCYPLADNSIDSAEEIGKQIQQLLRDLSQSTEDHQLRKLYKKCSGRYKKAVRDLEHAKKYLYSGHYEHVADEAGRALEEAGECKERYPEYSYGQGRFPFSSRNGRFPFWNNGGFPGYLIDSSRLSQLIQEFELRCSILSNGGLMDSFY
ncbi:unnamed protein product [Ilex paraguariensis]|uniref:Uncharacterized protein n=1 Tax=Ilex paraguariensis TaxID=185542 RepID=A0ABC8V2N4_9AQUA